MMLKDLIAIILIPYCIFSAVGLSPAWCETYMQKIMQNIVY